MTIFQRTIDTIFRYFKKDPVLSAAVILAAGSCLLIRPDFHYPDYIDWRTLLLLFSLMVIMEGFQKLEVFSLLAESLLRRSRSLMQVMFTLVFLCFFCSMLITNDVALITFVPFTISVYRNLIRDGILETDDSVRRIPVKGSAVRFLTMTVIMQTLAANLGSMLTPAGNPQNLYLSGLGNVSIPAMIRLLLPYSMTSAVLLIIWIFLECGRKPVHYTSSSDVRGLSFGVRERALCILYGILFAVCLLAAGSYISYKIAAAAVFLVVLVSDYQVLKRVDYSLLFTFCAFFVFTGNLQRIEAVSSFLKSVIAEHTVLAAAAASQVISNVPAALMLSGFTDDIRSLIIGTDLGGLGTIIASMASIISYKFFLQEKPDGQWLYLGIFTAANVFFLAVLLLIWYF